MKNVEIERLVFIDESAAKTNMTPLRGWSPKGERCYGHAPGKWKTSTMLSSIRSSGECKYYLVEGGVNKIIFKEYIEEYLLPTLPENSIIIMDNCKAHKNALDEQLLEEHKVSIKYLPPYSPDLNPIEKLWSKVKAILRKLRVRSLDALDDAIRFAFYCVSADDCDGWFRCAGYCLF